MSAAVHIVESAEVEEDVYIGSLEVAEPTHENIYEIDGVSVRFPYTAYQCQKDMMKEIITGVQNSQNCLLESPTGTGKTAAILCALLAWQQKYIEDSENPKTDSPSSSNQTQHEIPVPNPEPEKEMEQEMETEVCDELSSQNFPSTCTTTTTQILEKQPESEPEKGNKSNGQEKPKLPKIYYATRTHTQIKAVVTQLKKTAYSRVPMTILGSREQFCVNLEARKIAEESSSSSDTINKYCEDKRAAAAKVNTKNKPAGGPYYKSKCSFYEDASQADFSPLIEERGAVDIEDLVEYAKEHKKCPYYGSRALLDKAQIIFCTYNHLLQRSVRAASKIQFENSIFIFDEAHNIEGFCTSQASSEFSLDKVDEIKMILAEAQSNTDIPRRKIEPLRTLNVAFTFLSKWLRDQSSENEATNFERERTEKKYDAAEGFCEVKIRRRDLNLHNFANFEGNLNNRNPSPSKKTRTESVSFPLMMDSALFGPQQLPGLWASLFYMEDRHYDSDPLSDDSLFKLDKKAVNFISSLLSTLQYLFKREKNESGQNPNPNLFPRLRDYKIDLFKTIYPSGKVSMKLVMLCMNSGLVFDKMKECRTVIVTSGTLSPIESFASELDIPFERRLTANHVLSQDRYFVGVIDQLGSQRPKLSLIYANYAGETARSYQIRDDLGQIILSICKKVPNGILCFVPSKAFLKMIKSHFTDTGILGEIEEVKKGGVFWETDLQEQNIRMPEMIEKYVEGAKDGEKGAVLFAFCRGRVSEGVDFTDDQARAVITMGIPMLPPYADKIAAKKYYNDQRCCSTDDEFSGDDWYEASAFRALNQAFGRCIRHSNDWGAIVMIEERLRHKYYALSNWVKQAINEERVGSLDKILPQITEFVQRRTTNP